MHRATIRIVMTSRLLSGAAARTPGLRRVRRPPEGGAPDFDLAYVRTGPRERMPVLVVPGGPGLASVLPYRGLRRRAGRRGMDVLMVEHRGVGLSRHDRQGADLPAEAMRVRAVVDDLVAVLDAEGIAEAVVYGSSYGSYVAAGLGVHYPGRVRAMVLDSPILSAQDPAVERDLLRDVLWTGRSARSARVAPLVRRLAATGTDDTELVVVTRAAYELGGPALAGQLVTARLNGTGGAAWRILRAYADRSYLPGPRTAYSYEFDLVGTLAFKEMNYAPPPDGRPFDPALTYAALAPSYPPFSEEPFDLRRALPDFTWPTAVMTGRNDLRTPTPIAREVAGLLPDAVLVELDNGHSALETHPLAALHVLDRVLDGRLHELGSEARLLDQLPRRGAAARLPALVRRTLSASLQGRLPVTSARRS